jgi:predicted TIM-barrel enzyme
VTFENVGGILQEANGVIVSTALKQGMNVAGERNVKTWHQRIDKTRVRSLRQAVDASLLAAHA